MKKLIVVLFLLVIPFILFGGNFQSGSNLLYGNELGYLGNEAATKGGQGFKSFDAFKRAFGPAGNGNAWHHIVEQNPANISKFGPNVIHNTGNLMKLPSGAGSIHSRISGFYSSIQPGVTGSTSMTVRQWLSTKSFDFQYNFGMQKLAEFGW